MTHKYTGRLNKPIISKPKGLLDGEIENKAEAIRVTDERFSKFPDLFKAHSVQENDWFSLAFALAEAHVLGFKVIKPAGRKIEWHAIVKAEFRIDVDNIVLERGGESSVIEAIKLACRRDPWKEKTKKTTLAALKKHYYAADFKWMKMVEDAKKYNALLKTENQLSEPIK